MIGNKTGNLGEGIAEKFLTKHGFDVFTRNYCRKWGEIDLVMLKGGVFHFIEVKTVSRENILEGESSAGIRPEDNIHPQKLKRLSRVIQTFIAENRVEQWLFDVCVVYVDTVRRTAGVKFLENVVLPA